jgi:2-oxo-4-hydroxy-4-carboxy-5-ureidoimidazoline decarboxylase
VTAPSLTLAALNAATADVFADHLREVFEHAPWVAQAAAAQRPFASVDALHRAMIAAVAARSETERVAFFAGHPELAGNAARTGLMTPDSTSEQGALALGSLATAEGARWDSLNMQYRARFGFPFILCVKRHTRASALATFEQRLAHDRGVELACALDEIRRISRLRLAQRIANHGLDDIEGRLTIHVLDTSRGTAAAGMKVSLYEVGPDGRADPATAPIAAIVTDDHGGTTVPLLHGAPLRIGRYELRLAVGDYYRGLGVVAGPWAFLDVVPVVFAIAEPEGCYHVPLTVTPWAYAAHRAA